MCGLSRVFLAAFFAALIASSGDSHAGSLEDSVARALSSHPAVKGAVAGVSAAQHGEDAAFAGYFPEVSISATGGRVYQDNATSRGLVTERGAGYSGYGEGNVALRQMMFDGLETKNEIGAAQARAYSREFSLLNIEEEIVLKVAQSYVDILRIRSASEILARQMDSVQGFVERISDMVVEGVADEAELQQARDVLMIIRGVRADYDGQLLAARAAYIEVVGRPPPEEMPVPSSLYTHIESDVGRAVERAKDTHPLLQSISMDSRAARHEMKMSQAQMYPDVTGELSYTKSDKKDVLGGELKDARAVVRMSWGFSTGGKDFAKVRQKRSEHYEVAAKRDEITRQIERDIYQAYASYRTFQRKLELADDRMELNRKLLNAYKAQFEGSRISLLNLMRAESQMFNAELNLNDNTFNALSAEYAVLAASGMLRKSLLGEQDEVSRLAEGGAVQEEVRNSAE